jgi:hypothetical protein
MPKLDDQRLRELSERLPLAFYGLMAAALVFLALGSTGGALFLLVLGGVVHVARVGVEGATGARGRIR